MAQDQPKGRIIPPGLSMRPGQRSRVSLIECGQALRQGAGMKNQLHEGDIAQRTATRQTETKGFAGEWAIYILSHPFKFFANERPQLVHRLAVSVGYGLMSPSETVVATVEDDIEILRCVVSWHSGLSAKDALAVLGYQSIDPPSAEEVLAAYEAQE